MIVFVTGTGTDIGKTIATAALGVKARAEGFDVTAAKPLQTGEPDGHGDAATIEALTGLNTIEMRRYPEPLAPNLSARRAGMDVPSPDAIAAWLQPHDSPGTLLLVEGAGGLLSRWGDDHCLADAAGACGAPLIVVTSLGLGCLNTAELTVNEARRRGLDVLFLFGGSLPAPEDMDTATRLNLEEMPRVTGVPLAGSMPAGSGRLERAEFENAALNATARIDLRSLLDS